MHRRSFLKLGLGLASAALLPAAKAAVAVTNPPPPLPQLIRPRAMLSGEVVGKTIDRPGVVFRLSPMTRLDRCVLRCAGLEVREGPVEITNCQILGGPIDIPGTRLQFVR